MRNIEMKFLDEYKRVDNICADMYSCKNGISAYLAQMDDTPDEDRLLVPSWDDDYKALRRLRWLRNYITHEAKSSDCDEADLNNIISFHERILRQEDSLSLLYRELLRLDRLPVYEEEETPEAETKDETEGDTEGDAEKENVNRIKRTALSFWELISGATAFNLLPSMVFILIVLVLLLLFIK